VLGYGADVVVVSPQDVRDDVIRRLREAAGEGSTP
jgi:predicted DNA-binding transcriptional regulator YafY